MPLKGTLGEINTVGSVSPNVYITNRVETPIPRLTTSGGRSTVMELLWMDLETNATFTGGPDSLLFEMYVGTSASDILGLDNPRVVVDWTYLQQGSSTQGMSSISLPWRYDFQTQDGYGYLLPADAFNIAMLGVDLIQQSLQIRWKLFYRFVQIPIQEYVGLVQSFIRTSN